MKIEIVSIKCPEHFRNSRRKTDFHCCKFEFSPASSKYDRFLLKELATRGAVLSHQVNPGAANHAHFKRQYARILVNSISGLIAEYLWKTFINLSSIETRVSETEMTDAANQIDLKSIKCAYSIEVRSSFPRNGLPFALCHPRYQFDVIGPYSNHYKPGEMPKKFYTRTLFPFAAREFNQRIKADHFWVYLTGGATREMFQNPAIVRKKSFIPDDETSLERLSKPSDYLVIPFSEALDTLELFNEIKRLEAADLK